MNYITTQNRISTYISVTAIMLMCFGLISCKENSSNVAPTDPSSKAKSKEAIGKQLTTMGEGFAKLDADLISSIYTSDTQWMNAFGDWKVGKDSIRKKLERVFASSGYQSGTSTSEPTAKIRIIKPGVAVAWTYEEIKGQEFPNGDVIPVRKVHSLSTFIKQDGEWLVEAQIFMDEHLNPNNQ